MSILHKIEIAASCSPENKSAIELIKSLPHEVEITLYENITQCHSHTISFTSYDFLRNNRRYALILTESDLSYNIDDISYVRFNWANKANGGIFLDENDEGYDHVLTDVRFNDRSFKISPNTYSVCSHIYHPQNITDVYITLHTK